MEQIQILTCFLNRERILSLFKNFGKALFLLCFEPLQYDRSYNLADMEFRTKKLIFRKSIDRRWNGGKIHSGLKI
jgi:hypothetical protein